MFGERLKELRGDKTQDYIAYHIGMPRATYQNYEAGTREPNLNTLKLIANYFEVSIDYLLGHTDSPYLVIPKEIENMQFAFHSRINTEGLSKEDIEILQKIAKLMKNGKNEHGR